MTKLEEWAEELNLFDDATMKLEYLIELAKKPTDFIELYRRDDNLIGGCQSKIWVTVMKDKNNKVAVDYDSDAMITKGITHLAFMDRLTGKPQKCPKYLYDKIEIICSSK